MYYKIITCRCHADILTENEKQNVLSSKHNFNFSCNRIHKLYVWKCEMHPFVYEVLHQFKDYYCYTCKNYEVCSCCVEKRYNLNYRCPKFCLPFLPEYVKKGTLKIDYYLDEKMRAAPFFYSKKNIVCFSLDNPLHRDIMCNV